MRLAVRGENLDDILRATFEFIDLNGEPVHTSRGWTREVRGATLELTRPRARLSRSERRGRAISAIGEFLWYASGSDDPAFVERYIPNYRASIGGADVATGAYGPRLFGANGQFRSVVAALQSGPESRQAVIQLFDADDLLRNRRDVPCTCTLQFLVRDGALELYVYMRSNDAFLGLPHDVFSFTMLQELAASMLSLNLGPYVHMVGSLHVYDKHSQAIREYLDEGIFEQQEMPSMPAHSSIEDLLGLVELEARIRSDTVGVLEPAGYWGDLARVLMAWEPTLENGHVSGSASAVRKALRGSYFDIYVSDLQFRGVG